MIFGGKSERTSSFVLLMMNGVTLLCREPNAKSLLIDSADPFFEYLREHTSTAGPIAPSAIKDLAPCSVDSASVLAHEVSSGPEESGYQEVEQSPELNDTVLQRGAAQNKPMPCLDAFAGRPCLEQFRRSRASRMCQSSRAVLPWTRCFEWHDPRPVHSSPTADWPPSPHRCASSRRT